MSECTHNCETCSIDCSSKSNEIKKLSLGKGCTAKKIIGVSSGKGGVGKTFVTSLLASRLNKKGYKVGILDADILGPSVPKGFGVKNFGVTANEDKLMTPAVSRDGVKIMSSNLLLDNEDDPIIFRGALIAGALSQFYSETNWGELDYLFIDMPPGTGDVALTVYQQIPIDKVIIVTTPQSLVSMIVNKSIKMANECGVDVLGVVENMSYVNCPSCNEKIFIYGKSDIDSLVKLPLKYENIQMADEGMIEEVDIPEIDPVIKMLEEL